MQSDSLDVNLSTASRLLQNYHKHINALVLTLLYMESKMVFGDIYSQADMGSRSICEILQAPQ